MIIKKKCIVCLKEFYTRDIVNGPRRNRLNYRSNKSLCCSKQCSKVYKRIYDKFKAMQYIKERNDRRKM